MYSNEYGRQVISIKMKVNMNQTTIATKAGTFEVSEHQGKVIVSKNGKKLATLPNVNPWDKDAIVNAIEQNGKRLNQLAGKASTS